MSFQEGVLCLRSPRAITRITGHIIFCPARSIEARARTANSREETGAIPDGEIRKGGWGKGEEGGFHL